MPSGHGKKGILFFSLVGVTGEPFQKQLEKGRNPLSNWANAEDVPTRPHLVCRPFWRAAWQKLRFCGAMQTGKRTDLNLAK